MVYQKKIIQFCEWFSFSTVFERLFQLDSLILRHDTKQNDF